MRGDGRIKHVLIVHRETRNTAAQVPAYMRYLDHTAHRVSYVSSARGMTQLLAATSVGASATAEVNSLDDAQSVLGATEKVVQRFGPLRAIVALADVDQITAGQLRERLGVPGPGVAATHLWRDRSLMKARVHGHGLHAPRWGVVEGAGDVWDFARAVGFPVVIKPRFSGTGGGARLAGSTRALAEALAELNLREVEHQVEEYVGGQLLHADGLVRCGHVPFLQVSRCLGNKLDFGRGLPFGARFVDPSVSERRYGVFLRGVLQALALPDGAFHVQFFEQADGTLVFLDASACVGSGEIPGTIREVLGVDLVGCAVRLQAGVEPDIWPKRWRSGGYLVVPEARTSSTRVVDALLPSGLAQLYAADVPMRGEVLSQASEHSARFRYEAMMEEDVLGAMRQTIREYRLITEPAGEARGLG